MKPSETAEILRRIAAGIQNSKNPDRTLVARDIEAVVQKLSWFGKKKDEKPEVLKFEVYIANSELSNRYDPNKEDAYLAKIQELFFEDCPTAKNAVTKSELIDTRSVQCGKIDKCMAKFSLEFNVQGDKEAQVKKLTSDLTPEGLKHSKKCDDAIQKSWYYNVKLVD
jgi:hypothetical protein